MSKSKARKRRPAARRAQPVVRQQPAIPGNVSVRRESPGVYSVHVVAHTHLFGELRPRAGTVRRDRETRRWSVDDGPAEHASQDDAVRALIARSLG